MCAEGSKRSPKPGENGSDPGQDAAEETRGARFCKSGQKPARKFRKSRPLDETSLRDLALSYVARFATTGAKLEGYLLRKLRERGVAEDADGRVKTPDVAALVARLIELGYVDDEAFARSKTRDLTARGYGERRVSEALWAAGVDETTREETAPSEATLRGAAILLAKKRRFGPFALPPEEEEPFEVVHKRREKQVAAMLRAGHRYEHAAFILDAPNEQEIDDWLIEAEDAEEESDRW